MPPHRTVVRPLRSFIEERYKCTATLCTASVQPRLEAACMS